MSMHMEVETDELDDNNVEPEERDDEESDREEEVEEPLSEKVKGILHKERANTKEANRALKAANAELERLRAGKNTEEEDDKIASAQKAVEDKYRPMIVKSAVRSALKDAGFQGASDKMIKLIDTSDFEIDEDGNVDETDLDAAIEGLKTDFPQLFPRKRVGRIDGGREATGKDGAAKSSAEKLAAQLGR